VSKKTARVREFRFGNWSWRPVAFVAIVAGVAAAAFWFMKPALLPATQSVSQAQEEGTVVEVEADMSGLYPKVIYAKAGEPLTIQLTSLDTPYHMDGGGKHQFAIDDLDVDIIAEPKGMSSQTFTPDQPGEYEFYCDICCGGRANPTMVGRLVVTS